jgi:hypothetical protein
LKYVPGFCERVQDVMGKRVRGEERTPEVILERVLVK